MTTQKLSIRTMTREEVDIAIDWAAKDGWNPGLHDADALYRAYSDGLFIALSNEQPVGTISAFAHTSDSGFIGFHFAAPEISDSSSIRQQLLESALEHLGERAVGVECYPSHQAEYEQAGFVPAYRTIRYEINAVEAPRQTQHDVVPVSEIPLSILEAYDARMFGAQRFVFLRSWIRQPDMLALGMMRSDRMIGYGILRRCHTGYRIAPLFADTPQVAKDLFRVLASQANGEKVLLDASELNPTALELARMLKLQPVSETIRLYRGAAPEPPALSIFGITSSMLG